MFLKLILLFSLIPIIELALLIEIGKHIGVFMTIILVGSTGVIGVSLARSQGFKIISRVKAELNQGQIPADNLIEGLLILIGGVMLLTPGLLTDITGFSFIIPGTRQFMLKFLKNKFKGYVKQNFKYQHFNFSNGSESRQEQEFEDKENKKGTEADKDVIDVDYEDVDDEDE
jgi:UPF0716 protein FxsA